MKKEHEMKTADFVFDRLKDWGGGFDWPDLHDLIGTRYQQEVDLLSLFKDVSVYNQQVLSSRHVKALVDAGCRAVLPQSTLDDILNLSLPKTPLSTKTAHH
jgi:hypothetical protein